MFLFSRQSLTLKEEQCAEAKILILSPLFTSPQPVEA